MVREGHSGVPHVDHDQDLQPRELPDEDPGGHKALVFVDKQADFAGTEGGEFGLVARGLSGEDQRVGRAGGAGGGQPAQTQQIVRGATKPPAHLDCPLHRVHLPMAAIDRTSGAASRAAAIHRQRPTLLRQDPRRLPHHCFLKAGRGVRVRREGQAGRVLPQLHL